MPESPIQVLRHLEQRAVKGSAAPETGQAFERALDLSRRVPGFPRLGAVLVGQWFSLLVRAEYQRAEAVAQQLQELAARDPDPLIGVVAHRAAGMTALFHGDFAVARDHPERAIAMYRPEEDQARAIRDYGGPPHRRWLAP